QRATCAPRLCPTWEPDARCPGVGRAYSPDLSVHSILSTPSTCAMTSSPWWISTVASCRLPEGRCAGSTCVPSTNIVQEPEASCAFASDESSSVCVQFLPCGSFSRSPQLMLSECSVPGAASLPAAAPWP